MITLVTGNAGKLAEWRRLMPDRFALTSQDIDLNEIQSNDLDTIIADKARRAYQVVQAPVLVEDIAAGLDRLGGLPGPFIKFFEQRLGNDALHQLCVNPEERGTVHAAIAYYDGEQLITVQSEVKGMIVAARGQNGFGFDSCFVPDGQLLTYGEMSADEKDAVSHRAKAIRQITKELDAFND